jgi:hypothetical protein
MVTYLSRQVDWQSLVESVEISLNDAQILALPG